MSPQALSPSATPQPQDHQERTPSCTDRWLARAVIHSFLLNLLCGLCFGTCQGIIGVYIYYHTLSTDCTSYMSEASCTTLRNANCHWLPTPIGPGNPLGGGQCVFEDVILHGVNCTARASPEECEAGGSCAYDYKVNACIHRSGWTPILQGIFASSTIVGGVFGGTAVSWLITRFEYRKTTVICGVVLLVSGLTMTLGRHLNVYALLIISRFLHGLIGFGAGVLGPVYSRQRIPHLADTLGTLYQVFLTGGILIYGIQGYLSLPSDFAANADLNMEWRMQGLIVHVWLLGVATVVLGFFIDELPNSKSLPPTEQPVVQPPVEVPEPFNATPQPVTPQASYAVRDNEGGLEMPDDGDEMSPVPTASPTSAREPLHGEGSSGGFSVLRMQSYDDIRNKPQNNPYDDDDVGAQTVAFPIENLSTPRKETKKEKKMKKKKYGVLKKSLWKYYAVATVVSEALQLSGIAIVVSFGPSLMASGGIEPLLGNFIIGIGGVVGAFLSIPLPYCFRLRTLYLIGLIITFLCNAAAGFAILPGAIQDESTSALIALIAFGTFIVLFNASVGPFFWTLVQKVFPPQHAATGASLGVTITGVVNTCINFFYPMAVQSISGGPSGNQNTGVSVILLVFAGFSFINFLVLFFSLQEYRLEPFPEPAEEPTATLA